MAGATRKNEIDVINGMPEKRMFLSIISDYDVKTGVCELIDNAIDLWTSSDRKKELRVEVELDSVRQMITVTDNAGGVKESELRLLIAPGATSNRLDDEVIGIFGVGGKRAAVALGELVEIRTRPRTGKSFQIDISKEWLASDDWHIPIYEIPNIKAGTTTVEISKMRQSFDEDDVDEIRRHIGETYQWFIKKGCGLFLNGTKVTPISFERWAYPKTFEPRHAAFTVNPTSDEPLQVDITAGLIQDRDPVAENYGVYVYCNHRLIVKELRTRDVGYFITGEAGTPHPDASLCRVIVKFQGRVDQMPWNSNKSGVRFSHPSMTQIHPTLVSLVSFYSSLSRRLKHYWETKVYRYKSGDMVEINPEEALSTRKVKMPDLPKTRKASYVDAAKKKNNTVLKKSPWLVGIVESMGLVDLIAKQKLDTRNRAALIEPPRVYRRLHFLRGWSNEQVNEIFPGSS
jgi:Histidine kinase-, DNA gyrase B-, and HSP90-like ATPase